jgi:hypothetical protein
MLKTKKRSVAATLDAYMQMCETPVIGGRGGPNCAETAKDHESRAAEKAADEIRKNHPPESLER